MLRLHRITDPYEFLMDKVDGSVIMPGDFYYEDDEDGLIVNAKTLYNLKEKKRKENYDYSLRDNAQSWKDYNQQMKQAEQELLKEDVLTRKVWGHEAENNEKEGD